MKTVSEEYSITLVVNGVFGRNRTVKRERREIARVARSQALDAATFMPAWRAELARVGVKGGIVTMRATATDVQEYEDGTRTVCTLLFDDRNRVLHEERIEGAGVSFRERCAA